MNQKKTTAILLLIVGVLIGSGICFSYFGNHIPKNPPGTIGNTAGNLNNNGLFCEDEERIFFANSYDNGALYSWNPSNNQMKKLNNSTCYSINAGQKHLYYCMVSNSKQSGLGYLMQTSGIYRIDKSGKKAECLNAETGFILSLYEDYLFYQQDAPGGAILVRQNTDKSDKITAASYVVNPASIQNGALYYNGVQQGNHYLYTMDTTNLSESCMLEKELWNPIYQDGYLYYMDIRDNYTLHRYNLYEDSDEKLSSDRIDFYNVYQNVIFYAKSSGNESALMRMNADGSNLELIAAGTYRNINVTSGYTFFQAYGDDVTTYMTPTYGAPFVQEFTLAREAALKNQK